MVPPGAIPTRDPSLGGGPSMHEASRRERAGFSALSAYSIQAFSHSVVTNA